MSDFWQLDAAPATYPAIFVPGHSAVSYGELATLADVWRDRLIDLAAGSRPIIALEFDITVEAIAAYLGGLRANLPILLIEPGQIGVETEIRKRWQPEIIIAGRGGEQTASLAARHVPAEAIHDDLRLLLSTSGSTGDPKLVRLSGLNISANAKAIAQYLELSSSDRAITTLPFFYSYGLSVLNSYLHAGGALVLTERSVIDPIFWDEFRDHGVTSMALVPHQFNLLEHSSFSRLELPTLRYLTQAGGKLAQPVIQHFASLGEARGWHLYIMYGQTEAAPRISYVPPDFLKQAADTIGRAVPGGRLWLRDEHGAEIEGTGIAGELVYEGPNVMMGYAHSRHDLSRGSECSELYTGDIAERTPDGLFRIIGRLKRFVKLFGLRVSLDQIETMLSSRNISAHALAVDDQLVVLHLDADDHEATRSAVSSEYALPPTSIITGHLAETPLLPSGKTDQRALQKIAADILAQQSSRTDTQDQTIRSIFANATRSPRVGPDDSFSSLGGDSLSYIHVQMALESRLGHVPDGWENMAVSALETLAPSTVPTKSRSVSIDIILRLIAITIVIAQHASDYPLFGGAWVLITLMGYSAARFQLNLIADGQAFRFASRMLYPIVPLYFMLMLLYGALRDPVPASYLLLLGNYHVWSENSLLMVYWFVSLYAQIIMFLTFVAAVKPIRRALAASPWTLPAITLLVFLAAELLVVTRLDMDSGIISWPAPHYASHGLVACLPLFLLGWMLQRATSQKERIATLILAALTIVIFSRMSVDMSAVLFLSVAVSLLLVIRAVSLPSTMAIAMQKASAVTLFVYLLHEIIIFFLERFVHWPIIPIIPAILLSFAAAFVAKAAFDKADRKLLQLLHASRNLK